jgi:hypothetical protein
MMAQILWPVRQRPLITFFVLAYALSWWPWIFYALDLAPQPIVGFGRSSLRSSCWGSPTARAG